jgi:riboflavin biosynthesis pyrimidine reductase
MHVLSTGEAIADLLPPYAAVDRSRGGGDCWVMANMVGGLDGSAAIAGRVAALSNDADSQLFRQMRVLADVVLVGAQTLRAEGYGAIRLTEGQGAQRRSTGRRAHPVLAVVSRSLDLDWSAKAFRDAPAESRPVVMTCEDVDAGRLHEAQQVAQVVLAGSDRVDPALAIKRLSELGHRVILCEGGPTWLGQLVAADRIDELCLTIAPVMGGDPLPISVTPPGAHLAQWRLCHVLSDGDTLFLRYERGRDG